MTVLTVGEILWDVFPGAEFLGGAVFNCSAHLAQLGHEVIFLSAVGDDERGYRALREMRRLGLSADWTRTVFEAPTGCVTVSVDSTGQPTFIIHRPAAYDFVRLEDTTLAGLAARRPQWLVFGTLFQIYPHCREVTLRLARACPQAKPFYDVNLRKDCYRPDLVAELLKSAQVVKLNDSEVVELGAMLGLPAATPVVFCRENARQFGWEAVCVTQGESGCTAWIRGELAEEPGYRVPVADTVGAGDAFAAAFLHGLDAGWSAPEVARFANRVGALIASRPGGTPRWTLSDLDEIR